MKVGRREKGKKLSSHSSILRSILFHFPHFFREKKKNESKAGKRAKLFFGSIAELQIKLSPIYGTMNEWSVEFIV